MGAVFCIFCTLTALWLLLSSGRSRFFLFSHIVGYQQIALPEYGQYTLLTPSFTSIDATAIDLTSIAVCKPGFDTFTSKKKIMVQKMNLVTGGMGDVYAYTTAGNKWVNTTTAADVISGEVVFADGEAMCVLNSDNAGSSLAFQFSGQVALSPVSLNIAASNYTLVGNFTPVAVDLTEVAPAGANGGELGTSKKKVLVQKVIATTGGMGDVYAYTTAGNKWVNTTTGIDVSKGDVVFAPGEGMCVYNGGTTVISIKFPSPVAE